MPNCADLEELNAWLERRCKELWEQIEVDPILGTTGRLS
jgi:hypothetical protein